METILLVLLIILIAYGAFWVIREMGLPNELAMIIKVVFGVIVLFALYHLLPGI